MLETEQSIRIDAGIERIWQYVQDISRWAQLMPGYRECSVIDARESRWILKVGAGGLIRTVKVLVHVDDWSGPERVDFSYRLEGDPVEGGGSYIATPQGTTATDVTMQVRVVGSGALAPMWEAVSRPLLPRLARSFAEKLKDEIERTAT